MHMIEGNMSDWETRGFSSFDSKERRIRDVEAPSASVGVLHGKLLVVAGFAVCVLGLFLYCTFAFSAEFARQESVYIREALAIVAVGFLVWLYGAVKYIKSACDTDNSDDLF